MADVLAERVINSFSVIWSYPSSARPTPHQAQFKFTSLAFLVA